VPVSERGPALCGVELAAAALPDRARDLRALPRGALPRERRDRAQVALDEPHELRRVETFALQALEHTHRAACVARERSVGELEYVETCAVGDGIEHGLLVERARAAEQAQLLDLLRRGEEIPFDALREQLDGTPARLEAGGAHARVDPPPSSRAPTARTSTCTPAPSSAVIHSLLRSCDRDSGRQRAGWCRAAAAPRTRRASAPLLAGARRDGPVIALAPFESKLDEAALREERHACAGFRSTFQSKARSTV
jgi:hypothetical protein